MTIVRMRDHFATILAAIGLAGCDRAENGSEARTIERPLAVSSSGPLEAASDEPVADYTNLQHGFTIAIPDAWVETNARPDGSSFENPRYRASLHLSALARSTDNDFQRQIRMFKASVRTSSETTGREDFRAIGTDRHGYRVQFRVVRAPGTLVRAMMRYPVDQARALDTIAAVTLGSLTLAR